VSARVAVTDRFWFDYAVAFPWDDLDGGSAGTHQIVVCWHRPSGRRRGMARDGTETIDGATAGGVPAEDRSQPPDVVDGSAAAVPAAGAATYAVHAPQDTLRIRVKRLRRRFAADLDSALLRRLPRWQAGVLDTTWNRRVTWNPLDRVASATPVTGRPSGEYSAEYRQRVRDVAAWLRREPDRVVTIAAPAGQLARARYLAERIARQAGREPGPGSGIEILELPSPADSPGGSVGPVSGAVPADRSALPAKLLRPVGDEALANEEQVVLREFDPVPFSIERRGGTPSTDSWFLEIRDGRNDLVRRLSGRGAPPDTVRWDWCDASGRRVGVGDYRYRWGWTAGDGTAYNLRERSLLVIEEILQRTLQFGRRTEIGDLPDATLILFLEPGAAEGTPDNADDTDDRRDR
jgi:hypothetical protein